MRFLIAIAAVVLTTACNAFHDCSSEINQKFLPSDTTITVGQQFTAQVVVTTCDGREILSANPTWHSQDPGVASVDSTNGRVTGKAAGQTSISASGGFYALTGSIKVTVR